MHIATCTNFSLHGKATIWPGRARLRDGPQPNLQIEDFSRVQMPTRRRASVRQEYKHLRGARTGAGALPSYTNIFHCHPARPACSAEEAGERLPLGPISPSRILCVAAALQSAAAGAGGGGVSEYLSTRICGCDCGAQSLRYVHLADKRVRVACQH